MIYKREKVFLSIIFLLCLALRLYFAFQTPYFSYGSAYLELERIEFTSDTGLPMYMAESGCCNVHSIYFPFFHYVLAFFSNIVPLIIAAKILPNIFACSLVFIVFFIVKHLTKDSVSSLLSALVSGLIPVYFTKTFNSISVYSLVIPLMFCCLLFLMDIDRKKAGYFILFFILLSLTSSSVIILSIALLIYLIFVKIAILKEKKTVFEIILFTVFFSLWLNVLIYRKSLLKLGYALVWRNIPDILLSQYFSQFNILDAIFKIGLLPFFLGLFIIYRYIFRERNKDIYLIMSFSLGILLLLWLKLIDLGIGLSLLGVSLTILFGVFLHKAYMYISRTKFVYLNFFTVGVVVIIALTSLLPTLIYSYYELDNVPSKEIIDSMVWLRENIPEDSTVLSTLEEGFIISAIADRKNVINYDFLKIKNPDQVLKDIRVIYTAPYITDVVELLNKYDVKYIVFSKNAKKDYGIDFVKSFDNNCFKTVYEKDVIIYKNLCKVVED